MILRSWTLILFFALSLSAHGNICEDTISGDYNNAVTELANSYLDLEKMQTDGAANAPAEKTLKKHVERKKKELVKILGQEKFDQFFAVAIEKQSAFKREQARERKQRRKQRLDESSILHNWTLKKTFPHKESILSARVSTGSSRLVATTGDIIYVYDIATGKTILKKSLVVKPNIISPDNYHAKSVDISADGKRITAVINSNFTYVWDADTGEVLFEIKGHLYVLDSVRFSGDGLRITTACEDASEVKVWDALSGALIQDLGPYSSGAILNHDGRTVAIFASSPHLLLYDVATKKQLSSLSNPMVKAKFMFADWSPDEETIVTGSNDNHVRLWNAKTGDLIKIIGRHTDWVTAGSFSPDGKFVITGGHDHQARIWNVETAEEIQSLTDHGMSHHVTATGFSGDGQYVFTAAQDGKIMIWEAAASEDND